MNKDLVHLLAQLAVYLMVGMLPVLWIIFTDRFRRAPTPGEYARMLALVAFLGALVFVPAISVVASTALLALGIAWLAARYALVQVSYERTLMPARLFPGDEADLTIRLNNRKLLPLAWIWVTDVLHVGGIRSTDDMSAFLRFSAGVEKMENRGLALMNRAAVGPFQELLRVYRIEAMQRGVYTLGPARVVSGDPFGVFQREATLGGKTEIIVYPHVYRPDEINLPFLEPMGELITRHTLFEDPTLLAGSREYQPGDPMNRMHWKATARSGELQVRISDPSTTAQLMILLNLTTSQQVWQGMDPERMEAAIDVAASLAVWALDKGFAVGLRSNGIIPGAETISRLPASANPRQSAVILEHLARLTFSGLGGTFAADYSLLDESRRLTAGSSIIFVTSILTPQLIQVLTAPKLSRKVSVVYCGRYAAPVVRGLPIHLVTPPTGVKRAVS